MGFPAWTSTDSDPAAWHASVATAREFGLEGGGPTMIHVETMRGCGHAHHHDDLYLGSETGTPQVTLTVISSNIGRTKTLSSHRELLLTLGASEDQLAAMESRNNSTLMKLAKQLKRWHGLSQKP